MTKIILEHALETSLVSVVADGGLPLKPATFIPYTWVCALTDFDDTRTDELTFAGHVVRSGWTISHHKTAAYVEHVFLPFTSYVSNIPIAKDHLAFTV